MQAQAVDHRIESAHLLIDAIIQIESAGNPSKVGREGERGLMQLKAATWSEVTLQLYGKRLGFHDAFDPAANRRVGSAYLASLYQFLLGHRSRWKSDQRSLLLACYNAGPAQVEEAGFNLKLLPASTQDYVLRATALHDQLLRERGVRVAARNVIADS